MDTRGNTNEINGENHMARIRSIKPDYWTDEKIVTMSPLARLLFIGMWNFVDDYGRAEYSPLRLKMQILPADSADIQELIGEIRGKKLIDVYEVDNKEYFVVCGFAKHQKIDKRVVSKIPEPPKCPPIPADLPQKSPLDMERKGKDITTLSGNGTARRDADIPYQEIIEDLNSLSGRKFQHNISATRSLIAARFREGRTLEDFKAVHRNKLAWVKDPEQGKFYRPETLYSAKHFESYLNESPAEEDWRY